MKDAAPAGDSVLVMDGDDLVRWSAAEGLRESGYHVEVVVDAREALERCPGASVVLLEHDDLDVDGLALSEMVRARCPRCAVVLMAADLTPALLRDARDRGVSQVLEKPFSLENLADAIASALGSRPNDSAPQGVARTPARQRPRKTRASPGV